MSHIDIQPQYVAPGDLAHRKDGSLDPRPIEDVTRSNDGTPLTITLRIGTVVSEPLPLSLYRFTRHTDDDQPCSDEHPDAGLTCTLAPHSVDIDHAHVVRTETGMPYTRAFWNYGQGITGLNGIRRIP